MPTINTTGIFFNDFHLIRELQDDGSTKLFASVGYQITTDTGRTFASSSRVELTGNAKLQAVTLFQTVITLIKISEGV